MFWSKNANFFHYLFSLKIRLEIRFKNLLDTKEPFFDFKKKIFECPKNGIFPKGLTHAFGQKMPMFSLFGFGQNNTRNKVK